MNTAFIALGSNLDCPSKQISEALNALTQLGSIEGASHWYQSSPLGPADQPDYLNGAIKLQTRLTPFDLLTSLQAIENHQGRRRVTHWGARTLDLDILLFNTSSLYSKRLTIPHQELTLRDFVIYPLLDIDRSLTLPNGQALSILAKNLPDNQLQQLTSLDAYA